MANYNNINSNGWNCANCGTWVANGTPRVCLSGQTQVKFYPDDNARIAAALERIAVALEKLVQK